MKRDKIKEKTKQLVKEGTIKLSDDVQHDEPLGFMVFSHGKFDEDYRIFNEENEALDFAGDQAEEANVDEWKVFALFASDWKTVNINEV